MRGMTVDVLTNHDKAVWGIVNRMAQKLQYHDVDELYSRARDTLVKKMHKWDPNRGAFTTFAYAILRNDLLDYVQRNRRIVFHAGKDETDTEIRDFIANLPDPRQSDSLPSRLSDLRQNISAAAKEVLDVCLSMELGDVFGSKPAIEKVRETLVQRGWDRRDTHVAFYEIAEVVKDW